MPTNHKSDGRLERNPVSLKTWRPRIESNGLENQEQCVAGNASNDSLATAEDEIYCVRGRCEKIFIVAATSLAMIVGMIPMALAIGGGSETAPLGRAVIGGLLAATAATLFVLPVVFGLVQRRAPTRPVSLDPDDPIHDSAAALETA